MKINIHISLVTALSNMSKNTINFLHRDTNCDKDLCKDNDPTLTFEVPIDDNDPSWVDMPRDSEKELIKSLENAVEDPL